jgi:hypothetical protein
LGELPTEKEAGFSNDPLNSDDFKEQAFNETLMWFLATTSDETSIMFPPTDALECAQTLLLTLIKLRDILDTLGKPDLEIISAGIRHESFASSMLSKFQKMEETLPEDERIKPRTAEEIGGSVLMRRDFYYFSKAFLDDDTAKKKMQPWTDKAQLVCPCMLKKTRAEQVKCCTAVKNCLGLERCENETRTKWLSLWNRHVKLAELNEKGEKIVAEERKIFCWCGQENETSIDRTQAIIRGMGRCRTSCR